MDKSLHIGKKDDKVRCRIRPYAKSRKKVLKLYTSEA